MVRLPGYTGVVRQGPQLEHEIETNKTKAVVLRLHSVAGFIIAGKTGAAATLLWKLIVSAIVQGLGHR